jgi:hypothetical protein
MKTNKRKAFKNHVPSFVKKGKHRKNEINVKRENMFI